jgi:short-subunit dehydrogenase
VTGASSGIGADLARQLGQRGHGLTLVARREDRLSSLAEELSSEHRVRAEVLVADLTDASARASLAPAIYERGLKVELLVNNAGFSTTGPVQRADHEREVSMIRTDVEAVVDLCSLFVPDMVRRGQGAVLNVSSTAAFQPLPGQAGYAASKAFVLSYSHAIRAELRGTGVTVTTLCPGPVRTEFAEMAGFADAELERSLPKFMWQTPAQVARAAIEGLERDRAVVIPGLSNRIAAYMGYMTPREILLAIVARQHPSLRRAPP